MTETELAKAVRRLNDIFHEAEVSWLGHFKVDIDTVDWLKKSDSRYGVMKYMDFLLRLLEYEGWAKKLEVDKQRLRL